MTLEERTIGGLHNFLMATVVLRHVARGGRAVDLGAGSGVFALRLRDEWGMNVLAADQCVPNGGPPVEFRTVDLNSAHFSETIGPGLFDLVTAIEVIEHIESPIGFLRGIGKLLKPSGLSIVTTPNVDNLPARLKFLLKGRLRMLDVLSDPTHITPIFLDLFQRQYLRAAGLQLVERRVFPPDGFKVTRQPMATVLRLTAKLLPGEGLLGDNHVFVMQRREEVSS